MARSIRQLTSWWERNVTEFSNQLQPYLEWLRSTLFSIGETKVTLVSIGQFILILVVAWFISLVLRRGLKRYGHNQKRMSAASLYALDRFSHYIILVIGLLIAVTSLGIDLTKLTLLISALGIGVGFGLQNVISNFVAGIMLLFEKTLKVGDFVELESGVTGEVKEINIRSTIITTNDNIDIVVPNAEFVNGRVTNWTMRDTLRRVRIPFGVAYGTDKDLVKDAVLEAANNVPHTLTEDSPRPPQVWLVEMGDSALNFELVVWLKPEAVKRPGAVKAAFTWEIHSALVGAGIEIPFPQRDLHIRSWQAEQPVPISSAPATPTANSDSSEPAPSSVSDNDAAKEL